jgi:NTE family protein
MLAGEGRQHGWQLGGGIDERRRQDRHEQDRAGAGGARQRQAHLALDPIHDALGADIDRKSRGVARDGDLDLLLPALAGGQIVLVEPYFKAGRARLRARQQTTLQLSRGFGVRAGVAQKEARRPGRIPHFALAIMYRVAQCDGSSIAQVHDAGNLNRRGFPKPTRSRVMRRSMDDSPRGDGSMAERGKEITALVLQGGGALGSYQAGAWEGLAKAQTPIDWVAGISIGAINGALICGNHPERRLERLAEFWRRTSSLLTASPVAENEQSLRLFNEASAAMTAACGVPGFFSPRAPPLLPGWPYPPAQVSLYDTRPLRDTLLALVDFELLNAGPLRYSIGVVNARTGNFRYFDTKYDRIGPEHVMASGALPPSFPPIEIGGEFYWDGGIVSNTPLQYVLDYEGDHEDMCVFQVDLFSARGELPKTLLEIAQREKDIRYSSRTRLNTDMQRRRCDMRAALARLAAKLPEGLRGDPDWRLLEDASSGASTTVVHLIHRRALAENASKDYEFSRHTMERNWADGRMDVEKTLVHPAWTSRVREDGAVKVFDLTIDGGVTTGERVFF